MNAMPEHAYVYRAKSGRVVDGDTIVLDAWDLGAGVWLHPGNEGAHIRLLGVDCPERQETGWLAACEFTREWLAEAGDGWNLIIQTVRVDNFGRYLATVWRVVDGRCLNDDLLTAGYAVPYERTVR